MGCSLLELTKPSLAVVPAPSGHGRKLPASPPAMFVLFATPCDVVTYACRVARRSFFSATELQGDEAVVRAPFLTLRCLLHPLAGWCASRRGM